MAIARASQAEDEGSIPFARSIIMKVINKIHFIFSYSVSGFQAARFLYLVTKNIQQQKNILMLGIMIKLFFIVLNLYKKSQLMTKH